MSIRSGVCGRFARGGMAGYLALLLALGAGPAMQPAATAAARAPRLALLVGVGKYPQKGLQSWHQLNTHEEIEALRKILIERHGFAKENIFVLEDEKATGRAIRETFARHLVTRAQRGAVVFFHFSGHGQQVIDRNGDELDGLDESIVPIDAADQSAVAGEKTNILDDEFAVWLKQLGERMRGADGKVEGSIVLSFDSCFSGTMTRGALIERGRSWDEKLDGGPQPVARSGAVDSKKASILDLDSQDYMLLTATHSDQTAKERDGMGVYSRALVAALTRLPKEVSYRKLLHEVSIEVGQAVTNQTPDFEGNPDRLLFSALMARPEPLYPSLISVHDDLLTLGAGKLHLVSRGSVYALHREGEAPPGPDTLLGEAEVTKVEETTSELRLRPGVGKKPSEAELRRARVVEKEHSYDESPKLKVRCIEADQAPCRSQQLRQALGLIEAVQFLDGRVAPMADGKVDYDIKLLVKPGVIEFYRPDSGTYVTSVPTGAATNANTISALISPRLRAEWRWRRLFSLRAQSPWAHVDLRLVPVDAHRNTSGLVDSTPQAHLKKASASIRLPEGALYQLELTNPTSSPLWVTILELGPDGKIQPLFPDPTRPGEGQIAPGTSQRIVPLPYVFETTAPLGTYTLKIITTAERSDFSLLAQEAARLTPETAHERGGSLEGRAAGHPLGALLLEAISGNLVRSRQAPVEFGRWSVEQALLEVVKK